MLNLRMILGLIVLGSVSCREAVDQPELQSRYCSVDDPVQDLEWLHTDVETLRGNSAHMDVFVYTAMYHNERVFYIHICCPACGVMPPEVRNCEGNSFGRLGSDVDPDELIGTAMIWRTVNGICPGD